MEERVYIGDKAVRVLVPSRRQDGGILDPALCQEWVARISGELQEDPFGGATPREHWGCYRHEDGRTTREKIVEITSQCPPEVLANDAARERILAVAGEMCAALGQECIFVAWGDEAFLVARTSDPHRIPTIRFNQLDPRDRIQHLTMAWSGVDEPRKVLQVLSLDGWRPPPAKDGERFDGDLTVVGILDEGDRMRRAWGWNGDLQALVARCKHAAADGPDDGDLVFLPGDRLRLDVVMRVGRRFVGPRDLRIGWGHLNPVTRELLVRILERDWDALGAYLRQKPLDQRFFPKLRRLREDIEEAAASTLRKPARRGRARGSGRASPGTLSPFRFSVLVVGRIMALRFLAQKGWLPGGVDELVTAFDRHGRHYYRDYLKPLWFEVLNVAEAERRKSIDARFPGGYPYLDGGLFHQRPSEVPIDLPPELFDPNENVSFLRLFRDFEFSLNEYAGSDDSLKVDPSLFGKALESFNNELEKKTRGVHYTPKPLAWALALEGILACLERKTGIPSERFRALLRGDRILRGAEAEAAREAIESMRIVDPAVGSGVLLWACLEALLALHSACEAIVNGGDGYHRGSRRWGQVSRLLVTRCLHGVDISDEAVELTRLRLWLAVALSEEEPQPLPDLDLNIVKGDSLRVGGGVDSSAGGQTELGAAALERQIRALAESWRQSDRDPERQKAIRREFIQARRRLAGLVPDGDAEDLPFDWDLAFPHILPDRGFDLVIANPPYVRIQNVDRERYERYRSDWATLRFKNADIAYAFVELALRKLACTDGGQIAYLITNFRHHDAAKTLRAMLTGRMPEVPARTRLWVDFDTAQVFPGASNYVALLFAERRKEAVPTGFDYACPGPRPWESLEDPESIEWLRTPAPPPTHPPEDEWITGAPGLRDRIVAARRASRATLGELADISVGIQTSADSVYLFDRVAREDAEYVWLARGKGRPVRLEQSIVRRCVKGARKDERYLIFPYDAAGQLLPPDVLRERFPYAWAYLKRHERTLRRRESRRFDDEAWYRYGRNQGLAACTLPKVVVPAMLERPHALLDPKGELAFTGSGKGGGGCWALYPRPSAPVSLERLIDIVTSEEAWDHIVAYGAPQRGGWRGVDKEVLAGIPVVDRASAP